MMTLGVASSIGLGAVFLLSSVSKLRAPRAFAFAVLDFQMLPEELGLAYAFVLPPAELCTAILLLSGLASRTAALTACFLLSTFLVAIVTNLIRGRNLECHCFGRTKQQRIGWMLVLQDAVLLSLSCSLFLTSHNWVAAEPWSPIALGSRQAAVIAAAVATTALLVAGVGAIRVGGQILPASIGQLVARGGHK